MNLYQLSLLNISKCSTPEARKLIPYSVASELNILPISVTYIGSERYLLIVSNEEVNLNNIQKLKFIASSEIKVNKIPLTAISDSIFKAYKSDESDLIKNVEALKYVKIPEFKIKNNYLRDSSLIEVNNEITNFIDSLIEYSISIKCSDIHIYPLSDGSYIKLRVKGKITSHEGAISSLEIHEQIIIRIKVLSNLDIIQRFLPQEGNLNFSLSKSKKITLRVSLMPTVYGEKCVIRIPGFNNLINLEDLNFSSQALNLINKFIKNQEGSIFIGGTTGSGKTTTLYGILKKLSEYNLNIVTIEDPVEIMLKGVTQTSVDRKKELTYTKCLKATLRQDPDVILIGEVRDPETAKIALDAVLTGHIVLSSIHGKSVEDIILRLTNFGVDSLTLGRGLSLLIYQTLIPRLCSHCKIIDLQSSNELNFDVYKQCGCYQCDQSGYLDFSVASEILLIDTKISDYLIKPSKKHNFKSFLNNHNYLSLKDSSWELLESGFINLKQFNESI